MDINSKMQGELSPVWSEEDEKLWLDAKSLAYEVEDRNLACWIMSLKDRIQSKPRQECNKAMDLEKVNFWKPADGDDLPEIDREVIALLDNGKVVYTHRPPEYWDGKNIITGKVTRNYPKTYDKGGWSIPAVKYWLDMNLPKEIEP